MIRKESRSEVRAKKHLKIRKKIHGTTERPRLSVFRSDKHIYAQIIDDVKGTTLVAASTLEKDIAKQLEKTNNVQAAKLVGEIVARRALDKGVTEVVFDRGGYIYHGKVKALADAAREAGLQF
ncbi:MAG: large subunit ribosomal protein [Epulopiscium sp.]|jgi:large subunit ribosomal protein L18|uniref:Large ribosomal subunit protein uL18 n=1 Tax=Defluviitalea raffinosedens TaxID=1450156 RepID=A0A7C8LFI3_9FIRM|nr:50S ribosomal protein L18 [Defluviitalea raffinosedens]MBZ4668641.1 ribosomal protein [Defluviitaleaceae bacterium]MDK2787468.1 large subunit ribosomal protein [Candidatus Epulonipiscium sp.]KAE9635540.1 50S ribosomal protein L18 [Defluviitalea raffinosedens]MBM7684454.1 large subunit ribosomal protein L18 [Defluviitalea raffinosedens]HHW68440.1 50S ribosomal protein L18 [Candidatus Epulonipiscium sp.]